MSSASLWPIFSWGATGVLYSGATSWEGGGCLGDLEASREVVGGEGESRKWKVLPRAPRSGSGAPGAGCRAGQAVWGARLWGRDEASCPRAGPLCQFPELLSPLPPHLFLGGRLGECCHLLAMVLRWEGIFALPGAESSAPQGSGPEVCTCCCGGAQG